MTRSSISKPAYTPPPNNGNVRALNPKHRRVAEAVGRGATMVEACKAEGLKVYGNLSTDPRFQAVVAKERKKNELVIEMTREKAMNGFIEAVEMARIQADPATMIKGWTEIARMCGYYAPDTKKIEVSVSAKRLVDKFETMSDDELLKYAEKDIIDVLSSEKTNLEDPNFAAEVELALPNQAMSSVQD